MVDVVELNRKVAMALGLQHHVMPGEDHYGFEQWYMGGYQPDYHLEHAELQTCYFISKTPGVMNVPNEGKQVWFNPAQNPYWCSQLKRVLRENGVFFCIVQGPGSEVESKFTVTQLLEGNPSVALLTQSDDSEEVAVAEFYLEAHRNGHIEKVDL